MVRSRKSVFIQKIGVFVLIATLTGCEWKNWAGTEQVTPEKLLQPRTARELTEIISEATRAGKRVRMTGSGHSTSDVAVTNDVLCTPENLNEPLTLDRNRLKRGSEARLVRVQSGIRIRELNTWLDDHGFAMSNLGGFDGQTIAGVIMTATHGSGLAYGPLADQVVSLQMVVEGGRIVQIEPTGGITDPTHWTGKLEEDSQIPVELIQDNDAFNAARVSIGSLGVVYSVVLRVDQKFWLREVRRLVDWSELKKPGGPIERLIQGLPVYSNRPSPEHWELQYSPYANSEGGHSFLITERYRSTTPLPEQASDQRGQQGADYTSTLVTQFEKPLAWILDTHPELAKTVLEEALKAEVDDNYTNLSYKVFNIGVINYTEALVVEMAFDIKQTIPAIERSFVVADELYKSGKVHSAPIAIRFVKQTDALIAMQQGRNTVFMELIGLRDSKGIRPLLETHQKTYFQEFNARPHWGLDLNLVTTEEKLRALYPKWDDWKRQYRRFNVTGVFDGKATDRLGISVRPR